MHKNHFTRKKYSIKEAIWVLKSLFFNKLCLLTGEQVVIILPQFNGSLIKLPGALPGLWTKSRPHVLHTLFVIRIQEDYDWVPLGII